VLLVDVREQGCGLDGGAVEVLRPRQRLHQRADIRDQGKIAGAPQRLQRRQRGVKSVAQHPAGLLQRQELRLRQRYGAALLRVVGVARRIDRHHHVVGVVASVEKYAYQGLVIRGRGGPRREGPQLCQRSGAGEGAGVSQETAALHVSAPLGIGRK